MVFDWDESFELDLVNNKELDLLIYSWDPQYRHKLCYKGSVYLPTLLKSGPLHQLALKIEPRGEFGRGGGGGGKFIVCSRDPLSPATSYGLAYAVQTSSFIHFNVIENIAIVRGRFGVCGRYLNGNPVSRLSSMDFFSDQQRK